MLKCVHAALLLLGAQTPSANGAAPSAAREQGDTAPGPVRFTIGLGLVRYVAEEPLAGGGVLNREEGELERATLHLLHTAGDWTWQVALRQSGGSIDYTGRSQLGLPLRTSTDLLRSEFALLAERAWQGDASPMAFTLGSGIEWLRTRRAIRRTGLAGALTETLHTQQWIVKAGVTTVTALDGRALRLSAAMQADRPWRQTLDVDAHGALDPFQLRPTSRWGSRFAVDAAWAVEDRVEFGCHWSVQTYRPGAAGATPVYQGGVASGAAGYPGSVQKSRAVGATLTWSH